MDEEWKEVVEEHKLLWLDRTQSVSSIRRKFKTIHCKNPDSGSPVMPQIACDAKAAYMKIHQKIECSTGNSSEEDSESSDEQSQELLKEHVGEKKGGDEDSNMKELFGAP
eukprot:6157485-Ditylum_brightwellii.AAC.1